MSPTLVIASGGTQSLERLAKMVSEQRPDVKIVEAGSRGAVLDALRREPQAAIVASWALEDGPGVDLLERVRAAYPDAIRIAAVERATPDVLLRAVGAAQRVLIGDESVPGLLSSIDRSRAVLESLENDRLELISDLSGPLPVMPQLYKQLVTALQSPDSSLKEIGEIIAGDPAMTERILALVNSAWFGLLERVSKVAMAVNYLGVMTVSSLVLAADLFRECPKELLERLRLATLWERSLSAATYAKIIAEEEGLSSRDSDDAFTAGLLHGSGRLLLATRLGNEYAQILEVARAEGTPPSEAESRDLGFRHTDAGALMLWGWGLPDPVVEAVAFQDRPACAPHSTLLPLTIVHVASAFAAAGPPYNWADHPPKLDREYLDELGVGERVDAWVESCHRVCDLEPVG